MYSLLIDTHSNLLNIILYKNKKVIDQVSKETPSQSKLLIPLIKEILENQKKEINELAEIIVVIGPGSFTGVRLGVTVAKTISYCLNIPLKSISSLDLLAISVNTFSGFSVAIKDPKGFYIGEYSKDRQLTKEYYYISNDEYNNYDNNKTIFKDITINWNNIFSFNILKTENHYNMKPLYIKKIEVEK